MTEIDLTTRPVIEQEPARTSLALTTIAAALLDGMPAPTSVTVSPHRREVLVHVTPQDWEQWRAWWNSHHSGPWSTTVERRVTGWRHHRTSGAWRGWEITIVHLVPEPEVAEA